MNSLHKKIAFFTISALTILLTVFAVGRIGNYVPDKTDDREDNAVLYDTSPISSAYISGSPEKLSSFQREIYSSAVKVIDEIISQNMTDYEKELAIHDYIILHTTYDESHLSALSEHSENSDNPYGALINGKAICSGYSTTFQMFMDMLGIPCRTIYSTDFSGEEHAWNAVMIGDRWYYVDVTWDDPTPDCENRPVRHKYFNVTEEYMKIKHNFTDENRSTADGGENSYIAHNLVTLSSMEKIPALMEKSYNEYDENVCVEFERESGIELNEESGIDDYENGKAISHELYNIFREFEKKHENTAVFCQKVKYENRIVLMIYMKKEK